MNMNQFSTAAVVTCKALLTYIKTHGIPQKILSGKGPAFRSNSRIERFPGLLKDLLNIATAENPRLGQTTRLKY